MADEFKEIRIFQEGYADENKKTPQLCAVFSDFVDLQESPAGFGTTPERAINNLYFNEMNEKCKLKWRTTFRGEEWTRNNEWVFSIVPEDYPLSLQRDLGLVYRLLVRHTSSPKESVVAVFGSVEECKAKAQEVINNYHKKR